MTQIIRVTNVQTNSHPSISPSIHTSILFNYVITFTLSSGGRSRNPRNNPTPCAATQRQMRQTGMHAYTYTAYTS